MSQCEQDIVWLISNYVSFVWKNFLVGEGVVKVDKFFGFLTFKYKNNKHGFGKIVDIP